MSKIKRKQNPKKYRTKEVQLRIYVKIYFQVVKGERIYEYL